MEIITCGLDMYLSKKTYVKNWDHMKKHEKHQISIKKNGKTVSYINLDKISYIVEKTAYWRKANAIHGWFVKNVQENEDDCKEYHVSLDQLKQLLKITSIVIKNPKMAPKFLPCRQGFFFGNKEYDQYYFKSLEYTKKTLTKLLKTPNRGDYYYQSSW